VSVARIAVRDLVSSSYFPAIAAIALGFFTEEKLEIDGPGDSGHDSGKWRLTRPPTG
jgi:hypothetical protein